MLTVCVSNFLAKGNQCKSSLLKMLVKLTTADEGEYYFHISEALYVGNPEDQGDYDSFESTFRDLYPDKRVQEEFKTFDTFHEKTLSQQPETINTVLPMLNLLSALMNGTTASVSFSIPYKTSLKPR